MGDEEQNRYDSPPAIELTKLEAACRQLDTAIDLYFQDIDPVSAHALAAGGLQVLMDVAARRGVVSESTLYNLAERTLDPAEHKVFLGNIRESQNFLKHATSDRETVHIFQPKWTHYLLYDAWVIHRDLGEPTRARFFLFWSWSNLSWLRRYVHDESMVEGVRQMEALLPKPYTKRQFFEAFAPAHLTREFRDGPK